MKDTVLQVRLSDDLKKAFLAAAIASGVPAAQLVREFMQGYVAKNAQLDLLASHSVEDHASNPRRRSARR